MSVCITGGSQLPRVVPWFQRMLCKMGHHKWEYIARGANPEAYRSCKCCPAVQREDMFYTMYRDTPGEVPSVYIQSQPIEAKPATQLKAWMVRGRAHVVFGPNGPQSLADWHKVKNDNTIRDVEVVPVNSWAATLNILRSDFVIIDQDRLAYAEIIPPKPFDPFSL